MKRKNRDKCIKMGLKALMNQSDANKARVLATTVLALFEDWKKMGLKDTEKSIRAYSPTVGL